MAASNTTIQVSVETLEKLKALKIYEKESYDEVITDLIEDHQELSKETKESLKRAEEDFKKGRVKSLEQVKEELGL
ncbi:MAG: hypothetical protein WC974_07590 [Thermoplasmata archaeon]